MTKLTSKYTIFVDKILGPENSNEENTRLLEYLNAKGFDYSFVPEDKKSDSLIDQLVYHSREDKKMLLIVNLKTISKLCLQKSKYNNFSEMVANNRIKLIYYQYGDDLLLMYKLLMSPREEDVALANILRDLDFCWWSASKVGKYFTNLLENVRTIRLPGCVFSFFPGYLSTLMSDAKKTHTFFGLTKLSDGPLRQHRNILINRMNDQYYLRDALVKTKLLNNYADKIYLFDDLKKSYGKTFLDHWECKDIIPALSYYEKTYFELVTETLGAINGDDSFFITDKTLKPIAAGHPFILLSTKHALKNLRELGFKTFSEFIDESYDECDTVEEKVEIISKNLEKLDMGASKELYDSTKEIREHNQTQLLRLIGSYKFDLWKVWNDAFEKIDS